MRLRYIAFVVTILFVLLGGLAVSFFARGYRLNLGTNGARSVGVKPTGILVVTSSPDAAQILVNGQLESATNATITLPPDSYDVEVKKEGYLSWKKRITIKKEEVTKVDTYLFPAAPSLSPVTFGGSVRPILSPDGGKVVYGVSLVDKSEPEKMGIWVMDLSTLPIGFSSEPRRITNINPDNATWFWSPDGRQVLIFTPSGAFLTGSQEYTADTSLINIQGQKLEKILTEWQTEQTTKRQTAISYLPQSLQDIFNHSVERLSFSPDQKRILYIPSTDLTLPDGVIPEIPGSSTQKQDRAIKKGFTYIYDIKEDRNFLIFDQPVMIEGANPSYGLELIPTKSPAKTTAPSKTDLGTNLQTNLQKVQILTSRIFWFPSSLNVVLAEPNRVMIMDYDGTNKQVVFSGPYEPPFAIPFPNGNRLLMLTHFGAGDNNLTNLYSLGLK